MTNDDRHRRLKSLYPVQYQAGLLIGLGLIRGPKVKPKGAHKWEPERLEAWGAAIIHGIEFRDASWEARLRYAESHHG